MSTTALRNTLAGCRQAISHLNSSSIQNHKIEHGKSKTNVGTSSGLITVAVSYIVATSLKREEVFSQSDSIIYSITYNGYIGRPIVLEPKSVHGGLFVETAMFIKPW